MLKVNRKKKSLAKLDRKTMPEAGWKEREDLQQMIRNSPDAFFEEMGEKLLLVGEEIRPDDFVDDRIDLLAIDQDGATVILELKRGSNKLQLLQALSYAAMVSKWEGERVVEERHQLVSKSLEETEEEIEKFLSEDMESLNSYQRVILLAEDFDYEVLVCAEWLTEVYEMDIRCFRITLAMEDTSAFLSCTCIYPPPEITQHAATRGRKGKGKKPQWNNWDDALASIKNNAVLNFFKKELAAKRDNYLRKRQLRYRCGNKYAVNVDARNDSAYVWQLRRFLGDENFWTTKIGKHIDLKPVKGGMCLRFFLSSANDFKEFSDAIEKDLPKTQFLSRGEVPEGDTEE
ncbi:hypothetical protein ACFL1X_05325 [Candidatus Hydrogenedentota bacterium]